jgi:flagellar hook protein FlgE
MLNGISAAISAIRTLEKKLSVTANNTANVNTQGFKASNASSVEVFPQNLSTAAGAAQIGRGTTLGQISQNYSSGSFEPTSSATDMAVGGTGFFIVKDSEGAEYYTRDGQFNFDKDGRFVNTSGQVVQGWELDPGTGETQGSIKDVTLTSFTSPPAETSHGKTIINLNADAQNRTGGTNALASAWDGDNTAGNHIGDNQYEYNTSIKVYDSIGSTHEITFYFDKGDNASTWEYIVANKPAEDQRLGASGDNLGLLARGTLVFDSSGAISNMAMDTNDGAGNWVAQDVTTDLTNGYFTYRPDFQGAPDGSTQMSIQFDFGTFYNGSQWAHDSLSSTQHAAQSNTIYASTNGYGAGDLQSIGTNRDGVITGSYSNGEVLDLFQVAIAKFNNPQALNKIGNNLYSRTTASGDAIPGMPGTNGLGSIIPGALEQSNVDLATEAVKLIMIQRSLQANLSVIRTEDELIGDIIDIIS